ncbi:hypothetical protein F4804DRAFT_348268 [Jackrogersella minutella]|nr:hypothetical protein F4804DRAFT_348268 [Jackrogersella minutella]
MDRLPTEIFLHIISYLRPPLAPYTAICSIFQHYIEPTTFARINVMVEGEDPLEEFNTVFAVKRRRSLVREIQLTIQLPLRINYRGFTKVVCGLFESLQEWDQDARELKQTPSFGLSILEPSYLPSKFGSCYNYLHKHVGFQGCQALPSLACVIWLKVENINIFPCSMATICKALPRMREFSLSTDNAPRWVRDLRGDLRETIASTLLDTNFSRLKALKVVFRDRDPSYDRTLKNHLDANGKDRLSLAINHILKLPNLKSLELEGPFILSPTVFDTDDGCGFVSKSLEYLCINVSKVTPARGCEYRHSLGASGKWRLEFYEPRRRKDQIPTPWTWKPPEEFREVVEAAGHSITLTRGGCIMPI